MLKSLVDAINWLEESTGDNLKNWTWGKIHTITFIVDMSNFEANQTVIPTDQSGHPFHPHYDDQMPLWLHSEYHPMLWSKESVMEAAVDTLVLVPGG